MSSKPRVIHAVNKTDGCSHPFKAYTLCKRMVRFGGIETPNRKVTCKQCLKELEKGE